MPRTCLLVFVFAAPVVAAPVPKADPELERIGKAFGTLTEPVGCKLIMDAKNVLTVKMEKASPPKAAKPGEAPNLAFPEPTGVSFVRVVKGEFTATVRFQLKTDLTLRPDDTGAITVDLSVEYPSGESASISRSCFLGTARVRLPEPDQKAILAGTGSHTSTGKEGGFRGRGTGGSLPSGEWPLLVRIRCVGKKLFLEYQPDDGKWKVFDELALGGAGEAGEGKLKLSVFSFLGASSEVAIDTFEVK